MSKDNLPEGFSFQFGPKIQQESQTDIFLKTATSPTFPLLHIKIKKDDSMEDADLQALVSPKLYELVKHHYLLMMYCFTLRVLSARLGVMI